MDVRGDAGAQGGQVFVLESTPWHRVAHSHVVEHLGAQWRNYWTRDLLRRNPGARQRYEDTKLRLIDEVGNDRTVYTEGKTEIVASLLEEA